MYRCYNSFSCNFLFYSISVRPKHFHTLCRYNKHFNRINKPLLLILLARSQATMPICMFIYVYAKWQGKNLDMMPYFLSSSSQVHYRYIRIHKSYTSYNTPGKAEIYHYIASLSTAMRMDNICPILTHLSRFPFPFFVIQTMSSSRTV